MSLFYPFYFQFYLLLSSKSCFISLFLLISLSAEFFGSFLSFGIELTQCGNGSVCGSALSFCDAFLNVSYFEMEVRV